MTAGSVLVTGANGLVGNAVRVLLENAGRTVLPLDIVTRTDEGRPIEVCDLRDVHRLHAILGRAKLRGIVHCGGISGPMVARDNPCEIVAINIFGTANLLEVARVYGIPRFVFCSSTSAFGTTTTPGPIPEDVALFPGSVYGASKVAGEQLVATYRRQYGVDGVSLRLSWVFGPRRTTDCVIRTMIENALDARPTQMPFGFDFPRQYIYVADAAAVLVEALDRGNLPRDVYTVTGGSFTTLGEVAEAVRSVFPDAMIDFASGPDPVDELQSAFDISAAKQDLGFKPSFSLAEGVRAYADWLRGRARIGAD